MKKGIFQDELKFQLIVKNLFFFRKGDRFKHKRRSANPGQGFLLVFLIPFLIYVRPGRFLLLSVSGPTTCGLCYMRLAGQDSTFHIWY